MIDDESRYLYSLSYLYDGYAVMIKSLDQTVLPEEFNKIKNEFLNISSQLYFLRSSIINKYFADEICKYKNFNVTFNFSDNIISFYNGED